MESEISQRLQAIIDVKKINQSALADKIGTSRSVVNRWFSGQNHPSRTSLLKIIKATGCSKEWLIDGTGEMFLSDQPGKIAATISPGDPDKTAALTDIGLLPIYNDTNLRIIAGWLNEYYADNSNQSLFLLDDLRARYPSLREYISKLGSLETTGGADKKEAV